MDLFLNEQNFDLDKYRQIFYHSLKKHHKISNIPKFRCKMRIISPCEVCRFSVILYYAREMIPLSEKRYQFPVRNTK
jgi:hypothetical protein